MTTREPRRYAAKHAPTAEADAAIAAELRQRCTDGRMPCRLARELARDLAVAPHEVGATADLLELKIVECQLGLFGWPERRRGADSQPPPELAGLISDHLVDRTLPCANAWKVAEAAGVELDRVGNSCDALGIKITACLLGAF